MIINMIQNLENKMELQIKSLETKVEKMQEMFFVVVVVVMCIINHLYTCKL